jgi:hypothetical protein
MLSGIPASLVLIGLIVVGVIVGLGFPIRILVHALFASPHAGRKARIVKFAADEFLEQILIVFEPLAVFPRFFDCTSASKWDPTFAGIKFLNRMVNLRN